MVRRPAFAESAEKPKVLVAACVEVPGPSATGVRAEQLLLAFAGGLELDALSLKGRNLTHIQRVGAARMMRVPVNDAGAAEGAAARAAFKDRLAAFKRALGRQLENDRYDVVICLDFFAAAAALPSLGAARLVLDVTDMPSVTFDARHLVTADDQDTRTMWELGERAALQAAALIVVPSRQAARGLSERADPRLIRVFPRLVDTRVFQPPTVEIDLDDGATIAFLGGREGGLRTSVVVTATKLIGGRSDAARFLFVGTPDRGDLLIKEALQKRSLDDRAAFVDTATPFDVQQALAAADVVVVVGDVDGLAMPHRALESMACGRATIIATDEAACREHIVPDQHAKVVPGDAPERVADAVTALLSDPTARGKLKKAALRQAMRFDLGARAPEFGALLTEATGVAFAAKLPPLDEVTQPAPVARAVPATPLGVPRPVASLVPSLSVTSGTAKDTLTEEVEARAAPPAIASELPPPARIVDLASSAVTIGDDDDDEDEDDGARRAALEAALDGPTTDENALPRRTPAALPARPPGAVDSAPQPDAAAQSSPLRPSQTGRPFVHRSAVRGLPGEPQEQAGDVWAGDTMLDPGALRVPSSPTPEKVMGAMLRTDSGSASVVRPTPTTSPDTSAAVARPGMARSLGMLHTNSGADEWGQDTIADASPLPDPTKAPSLERAVITQPPRSLLVEAGVGDRTAEDGAIVSQPAAATPADEPDQA